MDPLYSKLLDNYALLQSSYRVYVAQAEKMTAALDGFIVCSARLERIEQGQANVVAGLNKFADKVNRKIASLKQKPCRPKKKKKRNRR